MPVNDDLADDLIRREVRYSKAENAIWRDIAKLLRKTEADLLERVEQGPGRTVTAERTKRLLAAVQRILEGGKKEFFEQLKRDGIELSNIEAAAAEASLKARVPVSVSWVSPSKRLLKSVVTEKPFDGKLLSAWVDNWGARTRGLVEQQINIGIVEGQGVEEIVRRLKGTRAKAYKDGVLETSRRSARAIVRTYTSHVTNAAREELYKANSDVIEAEIFTATLDHRTCPICGSLDGQEFPLGKGPRPPVHVNCRCVRRPKVKGRDKLVKAGLLSPGSRASIDGPVSADMNYAEWLKRQPEGIQKEVLGAKRFELFKSGTKFDKFVNDENEIIPLRDL